MTRVANARMYAVNPQVAAAWRTLLTWVVARADVDCKVIEYASPQPLPALWARTDLGCVFMCGYPMLHLNPRPVILAAPVPSPPAFAGHAAYWTDIVVRAEAPLQGLADVFGRRMAYTTEESQSGYQALRAACAPHAAARGGTLFSTTVGPLITPRRVIAAVLDGNADAGPLDSWFHAMLRVAEPYVAARLRIIARTPPRPIPAFVAAPGIDPADAAGLTAALLAVADAPELDTVRTALALQKFVAVTAADYDVLAADALAADALASPRLA